jgi:hypothetical protein
MGNAQVVNVNIDALNQTDFTWDATDDEGKAQEVHAYSQHLYANFKLRMLSAGPCAMTAYLKKWEDVETDNAIFVMDLNEQAKYCDEVNEGVCAVAPKDHLRVWAENCAGIDNLEASYMKGLACSVGNVAALIVALEEGPTRTRLLDNHRKACANTYAKLQAKGGTASTN